jgi:signal transduction histidine kinase
MHYVKEKGALPEASDYKDQQIVFHPFTKDHFKTKWSTEKEFDKKEDETESFRKLEFLVTVNADHYIAEVKKSQQETEDIVKMMLMITCALIIFVLLVIFVANRYILVKLWEPFNHTLKQLRNFQLLSKNEIVPLKTDINEVRELHETSSFMIQKVKKDYESLKNFSENASHEIQTPLAIIRNKIELLSQSENLTASQVSLIHGLHEAASKLSRLNQSLLLLTKIENQQFGDKCEIDISLIVNRCISNFEELAGIKHIPIRKDISDGVAVEMNGSLAEILISNLIVNAIKHNFENGEIQISLHPGSLKVINTGAEPPENTTVLFERFRKGSASGDSTGLGLAIVKTICDTYRFPIDYNYREEMHVVEVIFPEV